MLPAALQDNQWALKEQSGHCSLVFHNNEQTLVMVDFKDEDVECKVLNRPSSFWYLTILRRYLCKLNVASVCDLCENAARGHGKLVFLVAFLHSNGEYVGRLARHPRAIHFAQTRQTVLRGEGTRISIDHAEHSQLDPVLQRDRVANQGPEQLTDLGMRHDP